MRPNILVFVTDQHRADWLGCTGNSILKTPNIDKIAKNGTMFSRTYCNTPLCMPSRATMWTGLAASGHGVRTNGVDLTDRIPVLPEILQQNGYQTVSVGKIHLKSWHLSPEKTPNIDDFDPKTFPECETPWKEGTITKLPENYFGLQKSYFLGGHGSYCYGEYVNWLKQYAPEAAEALRIQKSTKDTLCNNTYYSTVSEDLYYTEWITEKTIECLDEMDKDKPFFMWCSNPDPHFPFGPPAPWNTMYDPENVDMPVAWDDSRKDMPPYYHTEYYKGKGIFSIDGGPDIRSLDQIKETKALAYGMVSLLDNSVGRVIGHLKKTGQYQNTIIVFISDHGELMGDHGLFCKGPFHYEGLLKVPFVIQWPGKIKANRKVDSLASILDFMPTILDLAGVEYPQFPARDWPGPYDKTPEYTEGDIYHNVPRLPGKSLKPVLFGEKASVQDSVIIEDDDDIRGVNLRTIMTERYKMTIYMNSDFGELFDLANDAEERRNLWPDPGYLNIRNELYVKMLNRIIETEPRYLRRIGIA